MSGLAATHVEKIGNHARIFDGRNAACGIVIGQRLCHAVQQKTRADYRIQAVREGAVKCGYLERLEPGFRLFGRR